MPDLMLLGLALAFLGGFALTVEWLEKRDRRRRVHQEAIIARVTGRPVRVRPRLVSLDYFPPVTASGARPWSDWKRD